MTTTFFTGDIENQQPEKSAALAALERKLAAIETDCLLSLPLALPSIPPGDSIIASLARIEVEEFFV